MLDATFQRQWPRSRTRSSWQSAEKIKFVTDTYTFNYPGSPSNFVAAFRKYYGPTMNAFDAAERNGRATDLQNELEALFNSQNKNPNKDATSIPATFLRVTRQSPTAARLEKS